MIFRLEKNTFEYTAAYAKRLGTHPHLHQQIELILVLEGETVGYADGISARLSHGDMFVAFPNQVHYYEDITHHLKHVRVIFSPDMCSEFSKTFKTYVPKTPVVKNVPHLRGLMESILACKDSDDPFAVIKIRGSLLILLSELLPRIELRENVGVETDTVKQIINYCYENFERDITLDSVADALHINKYHLSRLFSSRLGIGFCEYINSLRVMRACELLKADNASVSEIAFAVGYNSIRTFNRAFLKITGVTPREYRNAS